LAQGYLTEKKCGQPSHRVLPVSGLINVDHLSVSKRLKRLTVDMAAECSFEKAVERMFEHHGVELNRALVRNLTIKAGEAASVMLDQEKSSESPSSALRVLTMQMDGVMVPVVSYGDAPDRRKSKTLHWQELRVGTVEVPGQEKAHYASSFESADKLGNRVGRVVRALGGDHTTRIHGVGDGACWIPEQGERIGGSRYSHLIDYYHFCEYIHAAFEGDPRADLKVKRSKAEAKQGKLVTIRRRLQRQLRAYPEHNGVTACIRYIANRPGQFRYDEALAQELPIGSGQVESANRSLIQKRLKLPGAWWSRQTADKVASIRVLRANGRWGEFWQRAA
jgi:hypothetical protein